MTSRRLPLAARRNRRMAFRRAVVRGLFLLLLAAAVLGAWRVSRMDAFSIGAVEVNGLFSVAETDVRAAVDEVLQGNYAGVISRRFIPFYPEERVRQAVEGIPRVARATVVREGTTLRIAVEENVTEALWCAADDAEDCFFMSEDGIAYAEAPTLRGRAVLRVTTSAPPIIGDELLSRPLREVLFRFAAALADEQGLSVVRIDAADGPEARFVLAGGGAVIVSTLENFDTSYQNLASVLASEEFAHLRSGRFVHIDLRFNPKVFVQETLPTAPAEVATSTEFLVE